VALWFLLSSLVLQAVAAVQAARLAVARRAAGWALVSFALVLMFVRRTFSFYGALRLGQWVDPIAEFIALLISGLLAVGLTFLVRRAIGPGTERRSESSLRRLRGQAILLGIVAMAGTLLLSYVAYLSSRKVIVERLNRDGLDLAHALESSLDAASGDRRTRLDLLRRSWQTMTSPLDQRSLCVIGVDGRLLFHTRYPSEVGTYVGDTPIPRQNGFGPATIVELAAARRDWAGRNRDATGEAQIAAYTYSGALDALVAVHRPAQEVDAEIRRAALPWALGFATIGVVIVPLGLALLYQASSKAQQAADLALSRQKTSEARFRDIVESAREGIWRIDADGRTTFANSRLAQMLGTTVAAMLGRPALNVAAPSSRERLGSLLERRRQGIAEQYEIDLVRSDGTTLQASISGSPLFDEGGGYAGAQAMVSDVSELRRLTQQLAASRDRLRTIIETEPECVKVIGADGKLLEMNRAGLGMLEVESLDEVQNQSLSDFLVPSGREAFASLHRRVMGGETGTLEFEIVGRKGTHRWLETHAAPLRESTGGIVAVLAVTRDVSERRRLEDQFRQAQKMEAVGQLAGGVAHDFNNLLTVIEGNASLLLRTTRSPAEVQASAKLILEASERAANLTRDLLLVSRKQAMSFTSLDINEVVGRMVRMLQPILGEDVSLHSDFAPALPPVRADAGMLDQVLLNLAVNARDAMPRGGRVEISTGEEVIVEGELADRPEAQTGRFVTLRIRDNGCGIEATILPRIFEPFFTTKEAGKGTGLGLATVFSIVKQHGGWIEVESRPGEGTVFVLFLPAASPGTGGEAEKSSEADWPPGSETVLVVEDERAVRELVESVLGQCGYRVFQAESGREARALWDERRDEIDLLLTDIVLPGGQNGTELAAALTADKPGLKVLFTSGYQPDSARDGTALVEGLNCLTKPYPAQRLAQVVRRRLDTD